VARALVVVALASVLAGCGSKPAAPAPPPPPHEYRVVFPEGFTRGQMAARVGAVARIAQRERGGKPVRLGAKTYLAATRGAVVPCFRPKRQTHIEGFLFPSTYDFTAKTTSKQLVQAQIAAFCDAWVQVGMQYARAKNLTDYDVLKIASLVQGEAVVEGDRAKIAAVIYNRLHLRMPLAIDAALRYALHIPGTKSILESQLHNPTLFNLRLHAGLPPTPIDNPGLASMQAAAHPSHVDYLYFVAMPDKRHHFFTDSSVVFQRYLCQHGYGC